MDVTGQYFIINKHWMRRRTRKKGNSQKPYRSKQFTKQRRMFYTSAELDRAETVAKSYANGGTEDYLLVQVIKEYNRPNSEEKPDIFKYEPRLVKDKSEIPCDDCGGAVYEFTIPNDIWNLVIRPDGKEHDKEYLCLDCFFRALRSKLGLNPLYQDLDGDQATGAVGEALR